MSPPIFEKQPKKKRRIDGAEDSSPGPSTAVLPLVAPHLVQKSSKDPNRGMYPHNKSKSNRSQSACPQFVKASELYEHSKQDVKERKSKFLDSEPKGSGIIQEHSLNAQSTDSKSDDDFVVPGKSFVSYKSKGKRNRSASLQNSNKITKYLKSLPSSDTGIKTKTFKTLNASSEIPSSSDRQKNFELSKCFDNNEQFFKTFNNCYGLLESTAKEEGVDYFKHLPNHVIETIFCQIPIIGMMTCRLVCSRWNEIISNKKFMEWKKHYYRYKKESTSYSPAKEPEEVHKLIHSLGHQAVEDCIGTLVKYMGKGFNHRPSSDMYDLLMKNPKGQLADQVLSERFPEWDGMESRVWCQFALAILISETINDIFDVYRSLYVHYTACPRVDVLDAMYCIATFLLFYRNTDSINYGLHYRIYYVLYTIENFIPKDVREELKVIKGLPGQQSIHSYSKGGNSYLTFEQVRILNHHFEMEQKVRIIALAGTGKTTVLLHMARLYPQINFLNLVFNKSVSDDAKKRFPPNVTCQTAHSLAFGVTGVLLRHKLTTKIRPYELVGHLTHNQGNIQIFSYANYVLSTINCFTVSTATKMALNHVPSQDCRSASISKENRERILLDALDVWKKMINKDDPSIKITHDVYLKLYHLKEPKLHKYQCIMVDEAQDCNPVMLDIVCAQRMPVVLVGDPNQQIYGFRGAQNALNNINATHTYYLTKSFRFGPEIAYMASCILELLLISTRKNTIVGSTNSSHVNGKSEGQYAIISRSNVRLFNEAVRMVVFKEMKKHEPTIVNAAFAGGIRGYGFDQIVDICRLRYTDKVETAGIKDKFISKFKSYIDLGNYANYADDNDLCSKIELVNQHGRKIFDYIKTLKEKCNHPLELANVVFSTAHKAKGLEFDTVCLTDDYPFTAPMSSIEMDPEGREDVNVLYVALTRAKKCLVLPEKMTKILLVAHEKFEYPVSTKSLLEDTTELKCIHCEDKFKPHTVLVLMRRKTLLASGREIEGGPLCMKCGSNPYMRPDVHINNIIMYLDPTKDNSHRVMSSITGPLRTDPPIIHDNFAQFENADRVFVINLNIH